MGSPQAYRNEDATTTTPFPSPHLQKLRRFNSLVLIFRIAAFSFSLASSISMVSINHSITSLRWHHFSAFRYVVAANAIVATYSLFEMVASLWEISKHTTLFPQLLQVWFDFGHDQVFAYMLLSAESVGTELARTLKRGDTCTANNSFCVQSDISIALGFAGFLFLALSSLLSGFRVVCFINGASFRF